MPIQLVDLTYCNRMYIPSLVLCGLVMVIGSADSAISALINATVVPRNLTPGEPVIHRDATSGEPVIPRDATSGEPVISRDATSGEPIFHRDATSGEPVFHRDATSGKPVFHRDATSGEPVFHQDATSGEPVFHQDATSGEPVFHRDATSGEPVFHRDATSGEPVFPRAATECQKVSPCVCETADGQRVDLTPLANNNGTPRMLGLMDPAGQYAYSWNPCYAFSEGAGCQDVAVCQENSDGSAQFNLGVQSSANFGINPSGELYLQYSGVGAEGTTRTSTIRLLCDLEIEANFTPNGEPTPATYTFTLASRYACLTGNNPTTIPTPVTPPTPATPGGGSRTVTMPPAPTSSPRYSLRTVVDLLFILTLVAVAILVLLLVVVVVLCVRRGLTAGEQGKEVSAAQSCPPYQYSDKKQLLTA